MTLCPYKWFLYIASVWALIYVMVEAWLQLRGDNNNSSSLSSSSASQSIHADHSHYESDDDEDDDDDEKQDHNEDIVTSTNLRKRPPTAHVALSQRFPFKLFS